MLWKFDYPNWYANDLLSILMTVFEFSSAILNSVRCVQALKACKQSCEEQKEGLQFLLFEQGIFYFGIISLLTAAAVILNFLAPSGFFQRLLNALTLPLSGFLTARFLLHLREWEYRQTHQDSELAEAATHLSFRVPTMLSSEFGSDLVAREAIPISR
ncbi:hypothetical protein GYMLUDRAFT_252668 [Collybiopsis luxurians FD-317 M1]|uniref:Uncharacterized protein n=1 Tax=Collybiopsis luxurians FD-317 M1 TaxID=944289 RepID=A0A0D0AKL8_9AGAR|nr:hypothetical protein GYMLUDRAFT_252668 [Collybiopsis luxurians FD-317 M1]